MKQSMEKALSEAFFNNREHAYRHSTYDEEMLQYEEMKNGNMDALKLGKQMFEEATPGQLSKDLITSWKYMFVASTTLCCRFCMDGGMDSEMSYNISDLYIRRLDQCDTVQDIFKLHDDMFREYTTRMANLQKKDIYSRPVLRAMDYIDQHLHDAIHLEQLANYCGVAPTYLSALFSKEADMPVSQYIRKRRIEAAKVLLQYYDYTVSEISEYLAFSSPSHFIRVFRSETGKTPNQYREEEFRHHWKKESTGSQAHGI